MTSFLFFLKTPFKSELNKKKKKTLQTTSKNRIQECRRHRALYCKQRIKHTKKLKIDKKTKVKLFLYFVSMCVTNIHE